MKPLVAGFASARSSRKPSALSPAATVERYCALAMRWWPPVGLTFGEELGMEVLPAGDDAEKGGENIWISRIGIDLR